jgi:hypothetical protein
MKRASVLIGGLAFVGGALLGGFLFANSQPRAFLQVGDCKASCYSQKELAGLLTSAGITRAAPLLKPIRETDKCVAITHPRPEGRVHVVLFPKRDIKDIADITPADEPYVMDCLQVIRALVREQGLHDYRVLTNGPGLQQITYLHFHLISK